MGLFSAAFKAELEKGVSRAGAPLVYPVLELTLPSGLKRYCSANLASVARGYAHPRIKAFGSSSRSVDPRSPTLGSVQWSPQLQDSEPAREFATEVARYRRTLRGSAATLRLLSPNVPDANSFVVFDGVLDSVGQTQHMLWSLRLRPDDYPLQFGTVPKAAITPPDWPQADPTAYGTLIPIIYGIHDSNGVTAKGFVPTYYVDRSGYRYLVMLGRASQVRAVYVDGTLAPTSGYAVTNVTVNGTLVTLIDFTADQSTSAITCDVDGLTVDSDGTGGLITNPADQLLHFLANFVWGDWRSGDFLDP